MFASTGAAGGLEALGLQPAPVGAASHAATVEVSPRRANAARAVAKAQKRRRLNPKAAWPYVIGIAIFAIEGYFVVIN